MTSNQHCAVQHENPSSTGKSGYPKFRNQVT